MKIGAYYYPEQWPRDQWQRDFDNIAKLGLQIVHMGEFAWFDLEPTPGQFKFEWLDHCLDLAHQRKLDVILCTPTASPPGKPHGAAAAHAAESDPQRRPDRPHGRGRNPGQRPA